MSNERRTRRLLQRRVDRYVECVSRLHSIGVVRFENHKTAVVEVYRHGDHRLVRVVVTPRSITKRLA